MILNLDEFKKKYYYSNLENKFFIELSKIFSIKNLPTEQIQKKVEKLMNVFEIYKGEESKININPFWALLRLRS